MQYIGKDVLTQGSLLHLNKKLAWERLRSRAKQGIRKAQRAGIRVVESRDLDLMAKVWYNPDTLCTALEPEQKMFLSYVGDELCGGIIVTPVTSSTLFYHYGGTNELGRQIEANSYLFWYIVEQFEQSDFRYLDVGVSFRPALQHYFQKYCTQPYPILFRPPPEDSRPRIALGPFTTPDLDWQEQQQVAINTVLSEYFEAEFTYLPSWEFALQSAFRALQLPKDARIGVWSSHGIDAYLNLLLNLFGDRYRFSAESRECDAVLVCHRWGKLCEAAESLTALSVPLIEDCRDWIPGDDQAANAGHFGKYAVFDFARWFPLQFGAALVGEYFADQQVWDDFHCLDVTKRNTVREALQLHWPRRAEYARRRAANWNRYRDLFDLLGMKYLPAHPHASPAAFVLRAEGPYPATAIGERLREFGVSCESDRHENLVALPCHAQLRERHIDYIFGAFRGMVNPCHTYVRKDPETEHA
ncbi:hypothetical protein HZB60_01910 [candidate division KSB1 bacterium]|nr:hypothetical protein [candidate division KSB1 bacterium]